MSADVYFEAACIAVAEMSKAEVKRRILHFDGPLQMDFTEEYLDKFSLDKLQHILLAAIIVAHRKNAS